MPTLKGVWENVIASIFAIVLLAGLGWAASHLDIEISIWIVVVAVAASFGIGMTLGRVLRDKADLPSFQADLLGEAILAMRDYAADRLHVSFTDLLERGILAPARFGLSIVPGEVVRLSLLEPDQDGETSE